VDFTSVSLTPITADLHIFSPKLDVNSILLALNTYLNILRSTTPSNPPSGSSTRLPVDPAPLALLVRRDSGTHIASPGRAPLPGLAPSPERLPSPEPLILNEIDVDPDEVIEGLSIDDSDL